MSRALALDQELDGVTLAVLTNRFQSVVSAMMNTLLRASRSCVINTARDFSACIITKHHELLVAGESLPIHVMSGPDIMSRYMTEFHPDMRRGDAFLHNSPYHGNSHAADYSILIPIIDDEGVHQFTVLAKAHQADCGNAEPTTYMIGARDVYEEGALIFPCVCVQRDYADVQDIVRMCEMRIRVPEQWWGDHLATLGAARTGESRLLELGAEVGWDTLHSYTRTWFDYSEQRMDAAIRHFPSARVTTTTTHDPTPGAPEGIPVRVHIEVNSEDALIDVDLTDNADCLPCGLNLSEACARTAVLTGVFNSIGHTVPPNAGSFRRVNVQLRENCVVGIARHPASCSSATSKLPDRVLNAVQRGLSELGDGFGMAEAGVPIAASCSVLSGRDPRRGNAPFINQQVLAATGGAGGPHADGWLTTGLAGASGMMLRDSVEIDEFRYPVRIEAQYIIPDTEGAGRMRGSPGAYCEFGPVDCSIEAMYAADANVYPPEGARGGMAGGLANQFKRDASGQLERLPAVARVMLAPGETIVSICCGGGGYGPPEERDPERVRHDVDEGWIARERAATVYLVAMTDVGVVDQEATSRLRKEFTRSLRKEFTRKGKTNVQM